MYIAIKPFRYRGQKFNAGDEVPASAWPSRRALEARRKIRFVAPNPATVTRAQLKKMHRAELDVHARKVGIEDPESFPNRDLLIQAINGDESIDEETEDSEVDDSEDNNSDVDGSGADDAEEETEPDDSGDEDSEDSDSEEDASDEAEDDDSE